MTSMNGPAAAGDSTQPAPAAQAKELLARLSLADRIGVGAGIAILVASLLPWYTVSLEGIAGDRSYSSSAWDASFGGWFPVLLLMATAVLIVVRRTVATLPAGLTAAVPLVQMAAPPLAVVVILIRWLTYPNGTDGYSSAGAGFGLFLGLAVAIAGCVGGWLLLKSGALTDVAR